MQMMMLVALVALSARGAGALSVRGTPALRAADPAKVEKKVPVKTGKEGAAPEVNATVQFALMKSDSSAKNKGPLDTCGALTPFENSVPKKPEDSLKDKYDKKAKKRVPVVFNKGDKIPMKCKAGYTVDGSKDGKAEYDVECTDTGFFKPDGVCMKASKCGSVPEIKHAVATPAVIPGKVQFQCNPGYSLDGEKVVAGGMGKNQLFTLKCVEFSGEYEKFKGECKPYAFVASKESTQIYNDVFEVLFIVTCKGHLTDAFGKEKPPPVDSACSKVKAPGAKGDCASLVADIKKDFEAKKKEVEKSKKGKEWWDTEGKPSIGDDAMDFCTKLWKLVEKPNEK
jgi:hypothetical protein